MSNRQKIYISLAIGAGVCTGIAAFLYLRHRRQIALSKTPDNKTRPTIASSIVSSITSRRRRQYADITSNSFETDNSDTETVKFESGDSTIEVEIPGGGTPLTSAQAVILTRFLDENTNDIERLNRVLTNIANAATFTQNQNNLASAGCIDRLRELLSTINDETTKSKILLALNNLALNTDAIVHYSGFVPVLINLCRTTSSNSIVRQYGLDLLINMSALDYLHDEYMKNIEELGLLIQSTFQNPNESLSAGKILVNLSTNKSNVEDLLKFTGIDLKTIIEVCAPKKTMNNEEISKLDDILLRYLTFYCNLADMIINELQEKSPISKFWLNNSTSYQQESLYHQLFDNENQRSMISMIRPQHSSNTVNIQIKRFRQTLETIRQIEFESSLSSTHDEFNSTNTTHETSTPKKPTIQMNEENHSINDLEKDINEEFEDDNTILAGETTPSDQSLASFRSAYSTTENNLPTTPEQSITN